METSNPVGGYTVVELLIVMAVTAVTAVTAFLVVNGQQAKTEYSQAVRDFEIKLADIANDVSKGYFPSLGNNRQCTAPENQPLTISTAPGSVAQGSSSACVFGGKVIQFNPGGDDTRMRVITIAARRTTRANKTVTSLSQLQNDDIDAVWDLNENVSLSHGLRARSITIFPATGPGTGIGSIGFMSGFGSLSSNNVTLSGAPKTNLHGVLNTSLTGQTEGLFRTALRNPANYRQPDGGAGSRGIEICMEHGRGGRTALFSLGNTGRQLTTTVRTAPLNGPAVC